MPVNSLAGITYSILYTSLFPSIQQKAGRIIGRAMDRTGMQLLRADLTQDVAYASSIEAAIGALSVATPRVAPAVGAAGCRDVGPLRCMTYSWHNRYDGLPSVRSNSSALFCLCWVR